MKASEQLEKVLLLEQQKGYRDNAVMGGLDRFLRQWTAQAQGNATSPAWERPFQEFGLPSPGYALWDQKRRQEWVTQLLNWLKEGAAEEAVTLSAKTASARAAVKKSPLVIQSSKASSAVPGQFLASPITSLRSVHRGLAARLGRLGVKTVRDLIYFFPRRHNDFSQIKPISQLEVGQEQTIVGLVWEASERTLGKNIRGTEVILGDATGNIRAVWFHQPYLARQWRPNSRLVISGRVSLFRGQKIFLSPQYELLESEELIHTGRLVPVYPLTEGLSPRTLRRVIKETVDEWTPRLEDFLPGETGEEAGLLNLGEALRQIHYPDNYEAKAQARRRLAFDELFLIQLGMLERRRQWQESRPGHALRGGQETVERFLASLPFPLTPAQQRVLEEVLSDLEKPRPMSRLLQGEVGSGKTVVALAALLKTVANGYQGVLMAPTEILAGQHLHTLERLLPLEEIPERNGAYLKSCSGLLDRPFALALLTGSAPRGIKEELHRSIAEGSVDLVLGTHALLQREVEFPRLGLAVVDEQHRFGVMQRLTLRQKGFNPHLLVMTATPIPRTLALTLYGDLELSVIDQLPPGRQPIKTRWLSPDQRPLAYNFVRRQVAEGNQAFLICPLIEESPVLETKAVTAEFQRLSREIFPDLRLGLLHGRLPAAEKERMLGRFREGSLDILVATPVVEVGIDVPRATVMLIEGAERFGLAQLHQFRGRVGRGDKPGYCFLLTDSPSRETGERLALLEKTHNGFLLAEEDLRLRGPGEFFGTRQSGLPDLRLAQLSDVALLDLARAQAEKLFLQDPELAQPHHQPLAQEMTRFWSRSPASGVEA